MSQVNRPLSKSVTKLFLPKLIKRIPTNKKILAGLTIILFILFVSIFAPFLSPYDPDQNRLTDMLQKPSAEHWFGTDNFGRDILTRMMFAARVDLQIGIFAVIVPLVIGSIVGLTAGYYGGWFSTLMMRMVDIVISFPFLVLIIAIISILGPGLFNMFIAIWLVGWSMYTRIIRAEVLVIKQQEFVLAAKSLGYGDVRIMLRHILPNVITTAIVFSMSDIVLCILLGASLSFFGLGVQPPTAEWGAMIAEGRSFMLNAWWLATFPGLAIVISGLGFSLLGDGLAEKLEN